MFRSWEGDIMIKFTVLFLIFMGIGIFGYVGWGDPVHWSFLVPVAIIAAVVSCIIDPVKR